MTFRRRVSFTLIGLSLLAALVAAVAVGYVATQQIKEQLARNLRGIVATAALNIDGDMFARIDSPDHPYARLVRARLQEIAAANVSVSNIYTGRSNGKDFFFVVDGYAKSGSLAAHGEQANLEPEMRTAFSGTSKSNPQLLSDKYGTWISGYAPIKDGRGNVVGIVGADYSADLVFQAWKKFGYTAGGFLLIIALLAGLAAWLLGRALTEPMQRLLDGFHKLQDGDPETSVDIESPAEFAMLAASFNAAERSVRERDTLKGIFGTFLEKHVAEKILSDIGPHGIEGEMRRTTMLFSDIRGYTAWSEDKHPLELLRTLNEYFSRMIDAVLAEQGTIDKFIGDAMMVLFGAPGLFDDHADRAVAAGIMMQEAMRNAGMPFSMGIGINTADVVLGTVGSPKRMSYTAMGDGVNLAQRLESKAQPGQVLISKDTYSALTDPGRFRISRIAPIQVKGKTRPIEVYEVLGFTERRTLSRRPARRAVAAKRSPARPAAKSKRKKK